MSLSNAAQAAASTAASTMIHQSVKTYPRPIPQLTASMLKATKSPYNPLIWRKPKLSPLRAARYRKRILAAGGEWTLPTRHNRTTRAERIQQQQQQEQQPQQQQQQQYSKPLFKGHKRIILQEEQRLRVIEGLAQQPAKLKEYYESMQARRIRWGDLISLWTKGQQTTVKPQHKERVYAIKPITDPKYMTTTPTTTSATTSSISKKQSKKQAVSTTSTQSTPTLEQQSNVTAAADSMRKKEKKIDVKK